MSNTSPSFRVEHIRLDQVNVVNDPKRLDDDDYVVRLIGQIITARFETMKIVTGLPPIEDPKREPNF